MPDQTQGITLYAKDSSDGDRIADALKGVPGISVTRQDSSLSDANGAVHALAAKGEIILFRATGDGDRDRKAAEGLTAALGDKARVLAISDPDMPLAQARALLNAGVADVLPLPVEREDLVRALERMRAPARVAPQAVARLGKVIAVAQSRGGAGSTTVAVNLADALRGAKGVLKKKTAHRVAIVDLDLQFGAVAHFLDVEANEALAQMASDGTVPDATFVSQAMATSKDGIAVLGAPQDFVPLDALSRVQVAALLDQLALQYDYVVVDLPRVLVEWVQAVLNRADRLFLVTDSTVPAIRQCKRLIDAYAEENPALPVDVVLNQEARPMLRGAHHKQAAKLLDRELRHWLPPDARAAREALDRGAPLARNAGRSRLTKAIRKIAIDITQNRTGQGADPADTRKEEAHV